MKDIMEMEWRLEIFEDQGILPEAGIEEFKKRDFEKKEIEEAAGKS